MFADAVAIDIAVDVAGAQDLTSVKSTQRQFKKVMSSSFDKVVHVAVSTKSPVVPTVVASASLEQSGKDRRDISSSLLFVTLTFINQQAAISASQSIEGCNIDACIFFRGMMMCPFLVNSKPCPRRIVASVKDEDEGLVQGKESGSVTEGSSGADASEDNSGDESEVSGTSADDKTWMIVAIMMAVLLVLLLAVLVVVLFHKRQTARSGDENISMEAGLNKQGSNTFEKRAFGASEDNATTSAYTEPENDKLYSAYDGGNQASSETAVPEENSQADQESPVTYETMGAKPATETVVPLYTLGDAGTVAPSYEQADSLPSNVYEGTSYAQATPSSGTSDDHAEAMYSEADATPRTLRRDEEPGSTSSPITTEDKN